MLHSGCLAYGNRTTGEAAAVRLLGNRFAGILDRLPPHTLAA